MIRSPVNLRTVEKSKNNDSVELKNTACNNETITGSAEINETEFDQVASVFLEKSHLSPLARNGICI